MVAMETELVAVRFWSSPETNDSEPLELEMEFPVFVINNLDKKVYSSFELTLRSETYIFHKIDLSGEMPVIDAIPRLN